MTSGQHEIAAFKVLQNKLPRIWEDVHRQPRAPHSCLIIPSLSFDQEELQKVAGVPFYEERLMFMLMRLRRPGARVMYITSQPVDPDIVSTGDTVYVPHTHHIYAETRDLFGAAGLDTFHWSSFEFPPPQARFGQWLDSQGARGQRAVDVIEAVCAQRGR